MISAITSTSFVPRMGAAPLSVMRSPNATPPIKTISCRNGASLAAASSKSGRFGSSVRIEFLFQQFEGEGPFAGLAASHRIGQRQKLVELRVAQSSLGGPFVQRGERESANIAFRVWPYGRKFVVLKEER